MTLILSVAGQLLQAQLGVNELASAFTVGSYVGSIFTRSSDARIYAPLAAGYGLFVRPVPEHLESVMFDRDGTVFGENQRKLHVDHTLDDVGIDTIEGIATFLILILRYVETQQEILEYIKDLLRGKFQLVNGGRLAKADLEEAPASLPFSMKPLYSHVRAVLDADAKSNQNQKCLRWMAELSGIVGSANNLQKASKYSHADYGRFLKALLGGHLDGNGSRSSKQHFHTFSMGTAMICLAALANGANVRLNVVNESGDFPIPHYGPPFTRGEPFRVTLWLTDPPPNISPAIRLDPPLTRTWREANENTLPIHGGNSELAVVIASQMGMGPNIPRDEILELWERAIAAGKSATWESCPRTTYIKAFNIRLSTRFLQTLQEPILEPLSKIFYNGPRSDRMHLLARRVAEIYHGYYQCSDYARMDPRRLEDALVTMKFISGAFAIGCIRSLVSNHPDQLASFCWTLYLYGGELDTEKFGSLAAAMTTGGFSFGELLILVGKIWGGLMVSMHIAPEFSGVTQSRGNVPIVGVVCPHGTVLLDIINDPKKIARRGLDGGLISLYEGSVPLLPQDPQGIIWASKVSSSDRAVNQNARTHITTISRMDEGDFLFTAEPLVEHDGKLCLVLCAWKFGDVIFQLNPADVLFNLVRCRSIEAATAHPTRDQFKSTSGFKWIPRDSLYLSLKLMEFIGDGIGVLETDDRLDLQVIAAGHFDGGNAMMLTEEGDAQIFFDNQIEAEKLMEYCAVIICPRKVRVS
jgi:hypothetical protein